jgi:hypothetical protein
LTAILISIGGHRPWGLFEVEGSGLSLANPIGAGFSK